MEIWNTFRNKGSGKERRKMLHPVVNLNSLIVFFCGVQNEINNELTE